MLDDYEKKLRNIQDKVFEQNLDLVYFSKTDNFLRFNGYTVKEGDCSLGIYKAKVELSDFG